MKEGISNRNANGYKTGSLYGEGAEHYIVSKFQTPQKYINKRDTAEGLINLLVDYINT